MIDTSYDVIVIGGGVVGCAIARELSRYKLRTALLEKAADICAGQSKANTAIIHGGYDAKPGTHKAYYNVKGNQLFDEVCGELDVPYEWNTSLVVSFAPDEDTAIPELLERGKKNGVPGLQVIDHDEIMCREPNINPDAHLALLVTNGGRVLGCTAVADSLEQAIRDAYAVAAQVHFENAYCRSDIGQQALKAAVQ